MPAAPVQFVSSRDNPLLKELRRLAQDSTAYRRQGRIWVEGDHLCRAALLRGVAPVLAIFSASLWPIAPAEWTQCATKNIVIPDAFFADISGLASPAAMGFVIDLPADLVVLGQVATVILDRVQDAGNVGAILRSASAFGFSQVIALRGTAALWSPKVLRAGMGAHFGLTLFDGLELAQLAALSVPIMVTSSHAGLALHQLLSQAKLPMPCAWAFGHEGQGVSTLLCHMAGLQVRIAQPGGEESLNVASAAAICLHASATVGLA
jgi:TrmH family RNA methyltransferase